MELVLPINYSQLGQEEMMYVEGGGQVVLYASGAFLRDLVGASAAAVGAVAGFYLAGPLGKWLGMEVGKLAAGIICSFIFRMVGNSLSRSRITNSWYKVADVWVPFYTGTHWLS